MNFPELLKKPVVIGVAALILGLILGLGWGWVVQPVQWVDAPVNLLRADLQEEYLRMSIDSYRVNGDENLAAKRFTDLGSSGPSLLLTVKANPGKIDPNILPLYEQVLIQKNVYAPTGAQPATTPTAATGSMVSTAIIIGGLLAFFVIIGAVFLMLRGGFRRTGEVTPARHATDIARSAEKTDYVAMGQAPPVAQYVTTYLVGDDLFDDSFSIDSPSGEFLGECGVGISETIGVGDPKKVTAFEVWMFDKNDIQTVTKVLMSPHAFNDAGFRSKLEAKGELIAVEPHKEILLETQTLQMIATVSDMQYGQGGLPDGSFFDRITLELAIWSKKQA
jgi:hypothetical protein